MFKELLTIGANFVRRGTNVAVKVVNNNTQSVADIGELADETLIDLRDAGISAGAAVKDQVGQAWKNMSENIKNIIPEKKPEQPVKETTPRQSEEPQTINQIQQY